MMEEDRIYPPRFEVKVCGSYASESVSAIFTFRGIAGAGSDMTELLLEPALEGVLKCLPTSCSCSIIFCSLNVAAGGTASSMRSHPLLAHHSRSEPVITDLRPTAHSYTTPIEVPHTITSYSIM